MLSSHSCSCGIRLIWSIFQGFYGPKSLNITDQPHRVLYSDRTGYADFSLWSVKVRLSLRLSTTPLIIRIGQLACYRHTGEQGTKNVEALLLCSFNVTPTLLEPYMERGFPQKRLKKMYNWSLKRFSIWWLFKGIHTTCSSTDTSDEQGQWGYKI